MFCAFLMFIQILSLALLRTMGHSTIICIWWGGPPMALHWSRLSHRIPLRCHTTPLLFLLLLTSSSSSSSSPAPLIHFLSSSPFPPPLPPSPPCQLLVLFISNSDPLSPTPWGKLNRAQSFTKMADKTHKKCIYPDWDPAKGCSIEKPRLGEWIYFDVDHPTYTVIHRYYFFCM